ncbi:MAG: hypothetical protein VX837_02520 [Candidatus Thermoplasmatota archaeon]|nr:hypothetical protein [Candidatus Thermoplasmatota archaeon]
MDENDLRVGGWKKPRRITLLRLLGLLLVLALALMLIGPQFVTPFVAQVNGESPELNLHFWNDAGSSESQEYNGLLKLHTRQYESIDEQTGLLRVIALSALISPAKLPLNLEQLIINRIETEAELQRLELSDGRRGGTLSIAQGYQAELLKWDATVTGTGGFFSHAGQGTDGSLQVHAAYWETEQGLILCVAFGTEAIRIDEAERMIQAVEA